MPVQMRAKRDPYYALRVGEEIKEEKLLFDPSLLADLMIMLVAILT